MGVIIFLVCFCFFFTKVPVRVPGQKKKVVLFVSCPSPWTWHAYRRFILCTESHTRFTSDLPSIRLGYSDLSDTACLLHGGATFVCSCLPTFIFSPVRSGEGGTALSSKLRHASFSRYFAVRCGSKLRRAESSISNGVANRLPKRSFCGWGSGS